MSANPSTSRPRAADPGGSIALLIATAVRQGLTVDRAVKIGTIRGVVIGYNIGRRGRFPGYRFPLLVKTELGTAKFGLDEVVAV